MNFDTPLVEYLIIGTHTSTWLLLLVFIVFAVPFPIIATGELSIVLVMLPFIYLIGMLFDSIIQYPLDPYRMRIRDQMFEYKECKDEFIALSSPELYSAYEVRVRRVRVLGAAIFNWPLLTISLLLHIGFANPYRSVFVILSGLALTLLSITAWKSLYRRAYKFRKNACDIIREEFARQEIIKGVRGQVAS